MRSLAIALPVYFLGFASMAGTSLPMGTFIPNLLLGALAGRLLGSAFGDLVGRGLSGPGLYALMGAGAQLGGFTRVALTVTALMTEATGDVGAIAPLMLCCTRRGAEIRFGRFFFRGVRRRVSVDVAGERTCRRRHHRRRRRVRGHGALRRGVATHASDPARGPRRRRDGSGRRGDRSRRRRG